MDATSSLSSLPRTTNGLNGSLGAAWVPRAELIPAAATSELKRILSLSASASHRAFSSALASFHLTPRIWQA